MDAALLVFFSAIAAGALAPSLAYLLTGRGVPVRRAVTVSMAVSAAAILVTVTPLLALLMGVLGLAGRLAVLGVAAVFALQYLAYPFIVLRGAGARRPGPGEEWLLSSLEEIKKRMGYRGNVEIYVADTDVPNAFAVGNALKKAIVVHRGLLRLLPRGEVEAVIAHELGHIAHRDNSYLMATSFAPTAVYLLGVGLVIAGLQFIRALTAAAAVAARREGGGLALLFGGLASLMMMLVGAFLALISLLANLVILGFSRVREHMADMYAAEATGDDRIASALLRIEQHVKTLQDQGQASAPPKPSIRGMLYIVPMVYAAGYRALHAFHPEPVKWAAPLSTHPPTEARIYIVEKFLSDKAAGRG